MSFQNQSIKFHSEGCGEDQLLVRHLAGSEEMSGQFLFELELVSEDFDLDLEAILYAPAKVGILQNLGGNLKSFKHYAGCLRELVMLERGQSWVSYRAVLVPDMWKLSEYFRSRVFQAKTVEELVTAVLTEDLNLSEGTEFEWSLSRPHDGDPETRAVYPQHEYAVQYEEDDLVFVNRWLEHEGIFYYFDNDGTAECIHLGDTCGAYKPVRPGHSSFPYRPEGEVNQQSEQGEEQPEEVTSFHAILHRLPAQVILNDYNWRTPSVRLNTSKEVSDKGTGVMNEYNDHFKNPDQGAALAEVRAQELTCRSRMFGGTSTVRCFRPGKTFDLTDHFKSDCNASYLLVTVTHTAEQAINLETGTVSGARYQNSFTAIPADVDFRPLRVTDWPAIKGVMHARVDGSGDGSLAELDEQGRYKLKIPFDQYMDDAEDGQASRFVRMAQPYAGPDSGFHFPLLKGAEVLLTHIDGDPDRPIISAAVPNPDNVSPVDSSNHTQNRMQTTSGNMMLMDDDENATGFLMVSGSGNFIQDFRLPSGGTTGAGAGVGGGTIPDAPERAPAPGAPARPARPAAAAELARRYPNLPAQLREKVFGPGLGSPVTDAKKSSLEETRADSGANKALNDGIGKIQTKGGSLGEPYFLDSQVFPKKLEIRVGDLVKISQHTNRWHFADVSNNYSWGTGGLGFHQEDGDTDDTNIHMGNQKSFSMHQGTKDIQDMHLGATTSMEIKLDAVNSFSMTSGAVNNFVIRSDMSLSNEITVGFWCKQEIELSFKALTELRIGGSSKMDINGAADIEFVAVASAKTKVLLTPSKDDIVLSWEKWVKMKRDKVALQETDTKVQETKTKVQDTDTQVQKADTSVQEAETKVQKTGTKVQETDTKVQETNTKVQETDTKVQETKTKVQETDTKLQKTETSAMKTSTSGVTMIN